MAIRIITISRQYGSGGRSIGRAVAEELGIAFYDKSLLRKVAEESGYTLDFVEKAGEYHPASTLDYVPINSEAPSFRDAIVVPNDSVVRLQNDLVTRLAEKSPCVIVGRAADYLLRERNDVLNVFVHADEEYRTFRLMKEYGFLTKAEALKAMKTRDRLRKKHYRFYTDRSWGEVALYHLTFNTAKIPPALCISTLSEVYRACNVVCESEG